MSENKICVVKYKFIKQLISMHCHYMYTVLIFNTLYSYKPYVAK